MILANRHYVAIARRGLRKHLVMRTVEVKTGHRSEALRYVVASRHFTHRRALKRSRALNAKFGIVH